MVHNTHGNNTVCVFFIVYVISQNDNSERNAPFSLPKGEQFVIFAYYPEVGTKE